MNLLKNISLADELEIELLERIGSQYRPWIKKLPLSGLLDFRDYLNDKEFYNV